MKNSIDRISDDDLLARTVELVRRSRQLDAELIVHLAEVDVRQLYRREACPSMFAYATTRLGLSESEAYLRINIARVSRRFPIVLDRLAAGRIQLSAIVRLAPHLTEASAEGLLDRAEWHSKRQIEQLVAELAPKPDAPATVRKLPVAATRADQLVPGRAAAPAAVQRAVWQRDGGRCTFTDTSGRRCPAMEAIEFHHQVPFALGGDHSLENVRLLCKAHNRYQAELDFGVDFMRQRIAERRDTDCLDPGA